MIATKNPRYLRSLMLLLLGGLLTHSLAGQGITFSAGTFSSVRKKARRENKLVFLHVDNPACGQCTEVATKGFSDPALNEKFAARFVSYRVEAGSAEGKVLLARFEISGTPVSLFLTAEGSLMHRFDGSTTFGYTYLKAADEALSRQHEQPLTDLDKMYAGGDRSPAFLETYIRRRSSLKLPTDELLDTYARQLRPGTSPTESTLIFLLDQVPILGTKADSVMRLDAGAWNELFMRLPLDRRVSFNQALNRKTIRRAIDTKDEALAVRVARYIAGTYGTDGRAGQWAREAAMLTYYLGVKDTARYLELAGRHYDTYFMPLDPDSVNRAEQSRRLALMRPPAGQSQSMMAVHSSSYGRELNRAAGQFWRLAVRAGELEKALAWSERSLAYEADPNRMDTRARLLYKLDRREEALRQQEQAVARARLLGAPTASFEETRRKILANTLVPEPE